jgi:outer membrane protein assembly factor BamA
MRLGTLRFYTLLTITMFFNAMIRAHQPDHSNEYKKGKYIKNIIITGNTFVPSPAIASKIPYHQGELFDPLKTGMLIKNIYSMGYFRQISLMGEDVDEQSLNLHIIVEEKKKVSSITFKGNSNLSEKEIKKKIDFSKIPALDEEIHYHYQSALY